MNFVFFLLFIFFLIYSYKSTVYSFSLLLLLFLITPPTIAIPVSLFGIGIIFSLPRLYFLSFILVFLMKLLIKKTRLKIVRSSDDIILLLYIIYTIISLSWGLDLNFDLKILFSEQYLLAFLTYFIAANIINKVDQIKVLFKYLFVALIFLSIYGFIEMIFQTTISNFPLIRAIAGFNIDDSDFISKSIGDRGGFARVSGTFWNNIIYGIALTLFFPFFLRSGKVFKGSIFRFSIYFSTIAGLLTISRTAWFSMIYALGLNFKKHKVLFVIVLIALFTFLLPFLRFDFIKTKYIDTSGVSIASRIVVLSPVFNDLSTKEIFWGLGVGSYLYSNINKVSTTNIERLPSDNSFAQRVFTNGLIGVILFILFFYLYYRNISPKAKNIEPISFGITKATSQMLLIQLTLFFVSNSLFQDPRLSFVFFSVLGAVKGVVSNKNLIK